MSESNLSDLQQQVYIHLDLLAALTLRGVRAKFDKINNKWDVELPEPAPQIETRQLRIDQYDITGRFLRRDSGEIGKPEVEVKWARNAYRITAQFADENAMKPDAEYNQCMADYASKCNYGGPPAINYNCYFCCDKGIVNGEVVGTVKPCPAVGCKARAEKYKWPPRVHIDFFDGGSRDYASVSFTKEQICKVFEVPEWVLGYEIPEGHRLTAKASPHTYNEYRKAGWTDELLIEYGMMVVDPSWCRINWNGVNITYCDESIAPRTVGKTKYLCQLIAAMRTAILSAPAKA